MIKSYTIFNESNNLRSSLIDKLLSISGESVKLGVDTDNEVRRMLESGRIFTNEIVYLPGQPNRCHSNVADRSRKTKGFNIVSGYALSNGEWVCHSWGYNKHKNCIFETTRNNYSQYYGYELNKPETIEFCNEN